MSENQVWRAYQVVFTCYNLSKLLKIKAGGGDGSRTLASIENT